MSGPRRTVVRMLPPLDSAPPAQRCTCEHPRPQPVVLFDAIELRDVIECRRCGRPVTS